MERKDHLRLTPLSDKPCKICRKSAKTVSLNFDFRSCEGNMNVDSSYNCSINKFIKLLNENCRKCVDRASEQNMIDGDAYCFVSAAYKAYKEVAHHCAERGPGCELNSYVHIFLNNKNLQEIGKRISLLKAQEKGYNAFDQFLAKDVLVPVVGCLAGGGLAEKIAHEQENAKIAQLQSEIEKLSKILTE